MAGRDYSLGFSISHLTFLEVTSVRRVSVVAVIDSSVNCVCMWSTKKLTMPAYCVAANCSNSQMTPGITMCELLHNQPTGRQKWIYTIQTSWLSCCSVSRPFVYWALQWVRFHKPHGIPHGVCFKADMMFQYSFKILPNGLKLIRLYPCGSLGQSISFVFGAQVGHFAANLQSDVVGIWSRDLGIMATLSVWQKTTFFRAFITLRSQFHLHHCSQQALMEIVSKITPNLGLVL